MSSNNITKNSGENTPMSLVTVSNSTEGSLESKREENDKHNVVTFSNQSSTEKVQPVAACSRSTQHMLPKQVEMSIENFLSRPRVYSRTTWSTANAVGTILVNHTVPTVFFSSSQILDKLRNFRFFSCDVHMRVLINANKFSLGRLLVYALPYPVPLPIGHMPSANFKSIAQHTGYNCAYVDAGDNNSIELKFPFSYDQQAYDMLDPNAAPWVRFYVEVLNAYNSTEVDNAEVVVYMWMSNIALNVPTQASFVEGIMQSESVKQAMTGALDMADKTLATVHKVADFITPVFDNNSENLSWVRALSNLALGVFGFSKPLNASTMSPMFQIPGRGFTSVDGDFPGVVLGATLDNQVLVENCEGAVDSDEMDIATYCSRRALISQFVWKKTDPAGTVLFKWPVSPGMGIKGDDAGTHICSPLSFVASMFQNWRGGIKYHLAIVANRFFSGRIEFVFLSGVMANKVGSTIAIGAIEGAPRVICDIKESTDCSFEIPFVSSFPWLETAIRSPVEGYNGELNTTLGTVVVLVHNALKGPSSVPDQIPINVFVSGSRDIEFANPCTTWNVHPQVEAQMQSMPVDAARNEEIDKEVHIMTDGNPLGLLPAKTSIGESIKNLRQLTRRLQLEYATSVPDANALVVDPHYYGEDWLPTHGSNLMFTIASSFRYWKGSRRYMFSVSDVVGNANYGTVLSYTSRQNYITPPSRAHTTPTFSVRGNGFETLFATNINSLPCVVAPFYSYKSKIAFGTTTDRNVVNTIVRAAGESTYISVYTAAGDDWSAFVRLAPPVIKQTTL